MDDVFEKNREILDDILIEFHKNIHTALLCYNVFDEISNYAEKINNENHGYSFGIYLKLALEGMVLRVCNIYEPIDNKYVKFSVGQILQMLRECKPIDPERLASFIELLGVKKNSGKPIDEDFIRIASSKMPNRDRNSVLKKLTLFRNDRIAHPKYFEDNDSHNLPSLENITELIDWGKNFGETVSEAYLTSYWDHSYDAGRIKMALKRLFATLDVKDNN